MESETKIKPLDLLLQAVLTVLILLAPLPFGSPAPWAVGACWVLVGVALLCWWWRLVPEGTLVFHRHPMWWVILAFLLYGGAQLVPLPPALLAWLSPKGAALWAEARSLGASVGDWLPISVSPGLTRQAMVRLLLPAALFFVLVQAIRHRWQLQWLFAALALSGFFQVCYGGYEFFSGRKQIFWHKPEEFYAISGTFLNYNHFAGMLGMLVPVMLGFSLAALLRVVEGGRTVNQSARFRLHRALANPRHNWTVLVVIVALAMAAAILLSGSRSATLVLGLSLILMTAFLLVRRRHRNWALVPVLVAVAVLFLAVYFGFDRTRNRLTSMADGLDSSTLGRLELWRAGVQMLKEYPKTGIGAGATPALLYRYQGVALGDRYGTHLHNDLLQGFVEFGIPGGLLIFLMGLTFLWVELRAIQQRRDAYYRWLVIGCYLGVISLLVHGFTDFHFSTSTSNFLIFAILAAMVVAGNRLRSSQKGSESKWDEWRWEGASAGLRVVLALVGTGLLVLFLRWPVSQALADVRLAELQTQARTELGNPRYNHFLPLVEPAPAAPTEAPETLYLPAAWQSELQALAKLDPGKAQWPMLQARLAVLAADLPLRQEAWANASRLFNAEDLKRPEELASFQQLQGTFLTNLRRQDSPARTGALETARAEMALALARDPAWFRYRLELARVLAELDPEGAAFLAALKASRQAAPNSPSNLDALGRLLLIRLDRFPEHPDRAGLEALAKDILQRLLYLDSERGPTFYKLLYQMGDRTSIKAVDITPRNLVAYEALYSFFAEQQDLSAMLATLDDLEALAKDHRTGASLVEYLAFIQADEVAGAPSAQGEETVSVSLAAPMPAMRNFDERSREAILATVYQRRAILQRRQGKFIEAQATATQFLSLLTREQIDPIKACRDLMQRGRYTEALGQLDRIQRFNYRHPQALLLRAALLKDPNARQVMDIKSLERSQSVLLRLLLLNPVLPAESLAEVTPLLGSLAQGSTQERWTELLLRGLEAQHGNRPVEALAHLESLTQLSLDEQLTWPFSHLAWQATGQAQMSLGRTHLARQAWLEVLRLVPNHLAALDQLLALAKADPGAWPSDAPTPNDLAMRRQSLTPSLAIPVTFQGPFTLLGVAPGRREQHQELRSPGVSVSQTQVIQQLVLYWRAEESVDLPVSMRLRLHDSQGLILGTSVVDLRQAVRVRLGGETEYRSFRAGEVFATALDLGGNLSLVKQISLVLSSKTRGTMRADVGVAWGDFPLDMASFMGPIATLPAEATPGEAGSTPSPAPDSLPAPAPSPAPTPAPGDGAGLPPATPAP